MPNPREDEEETCPDCGEPLDECICGDDDSDVDEEE